VSKTETERPLELADPATTLSLGRRVLIIAERSGALREGEC